MGDKVKPSLESSVAEQHRQLLKRVKRVLREQVSEVRIGERAQKSAACLVLNEHDLGYQMRELLKAAGHEAPASVPALELNPAHPLVRRMDAENNEQRFERLALLVFEQAVLAEGRSLRTRQPSSSGLNELLTELPPPA